MSVSECCRVPSTVPAPTPLIIDMGSLSWSSESATAYIDNASDIILVARAVAALSHTYTLTLHLPSSLPVIGSKVTISATVGAANRSNVNFNNFFIVRATSIMKALGSVSFAGITNQASTNSKIMTFAYVGDGFWTGFSAADGC